MMNQQPQARQNGAWVRLWLVPQTEGVEMPPYVEGFLIEETPGSYVLSRVIEERQNEDFDYEKVAIEEHNFINRTYVWRCQVLGYDPTATVEGYNGEGGLG